MGSDDEPLDPAATDQLARDLGQGPVTWPWSEPPPAAPPIDSSVPGPAPLPPAAPPIDPGFVGAPAGAPPLPAMPAPTGVAALPDIAIHTEQPGEFPVPDAVTGAGGSPTFGGAQQALTPQQQYQQTATTYATHPEQLLGRLTAGGPLDDATQQYLNEMAKRDPQGFAEVQQRLADTKLKALAAEQHRIANADWQAQQANLEMRNKAIAEAQRRGAELDARAQELANTKVDPTGGMSTGQRIAGVLAAVVGGLYQGKTGSARNPGLDALNEVINRRVAAQQTELAGKREGLSAERSALANEFARSGDLYQAAEVTRMASLKHADDLLATQQQDYAPDGTRGLQIAAMRAGIGAQQAQARQAYEQKTFENSVKLQGAAREQQLADETLRHNRAEESLAWTKEAREGSKAKADNTVLTPAQIRQQFPDFPVTAIPPGGATVGDLTKRNELYNKGQETSAKGLENSVSEAGTIVRNPVTKQPLIDSQTGQPARLDKEHAGKLTDEIGNAQQFVDGLADIRRDLETDPAMWDRQKWAAVTAKYEHAKARFIKAVGANPSSREFEAVEEMFGTNFHGFTARVKDKGTATSRIDALIDLTQNDALTSANVKLGYGGKPFLRDPRQNPAHQASPEEQATAEALTRLKSEPNISYGTALDQATHLHLAGLPVGPDGMVPLDIARQAIHAARAEAEDYKDISPQQRRDLEQLGGRAVAGDAKALASLADVAKAGHSKLVRRLAQDALDRAKNAGDDRLVGNVFGDSVPSGASPGVQ